MAKSIRRCKIIADAHTREQQIWRPEYMLLETARYTGRKCTGHEHSRGWYPVSVQLATPTSFYLFSGKLAHLNKIIRFNTFIVRMKMNPCEEIRQRQMPQTFQEEMKWFAKGFHQPKTRREISSATIDAFQVMIWNKSFDDLLRTHGGYFGRFRHLFPEEHII